MKDLLKMYSFESVHKSEQETKLADWICNRLNQLGIEGYTRYVNNIYKLNQEGRPILSAHLDQVKTNGRAEHFFQDSQSHIRGYTKDFEQTSLGGDDKNGIWIILKLLEEGVKDINFIISAGEECGCLGIKALEKNGALACISSSQFCIVLDRRGSQDVLDCGSGSTYCKTLAQDICNYLHDMTVTSGSLSDTATLSTYCESVNMSVAYEAPHTALEHTNFNRLVEIKEYVKKLVTDFVHYSTQPTVYNHTRTTNKYSKEDYRSYYGGMYYEGY